ncbi:EamA family transporter [Pedobacter soli]|uniref:Threonine/homoserine efflux transporter RhtA n=1 Tax=Pedobacter soli TaxID=390242 RepID=A0A1G6ITH4_9SPHI|nr:EamA family transporter [Pedobacter soli]SDC09733.1 Threonine/homoserine efflux transporter RhtA [Pedobacter soli]
MHLNYKQAVLLTLLAASLWGISGTFGQFLFNERDMNVEWLITVRLLISGSCLLLFARFREKADTMAIWREKKNIVPLLVFGIFGMLGVQYTYFAAIKHSNAATATVLQFTGPIIIALYLAAKYRRVPPFLELIAILLAILGTFLLVTQGRFDSLSISTTALFFGLASAVTLALYSLQPKMLMQKYNASIVAGWGMLIGGVAFCFIHAPWAIEGKWDYQTVISLAVIIILGTLIAFYAYLSGAKIIGAQKASLLASAEPLVAVIISVVWLKTSFGLIDWIGSLLIISTIFLLSKNK